MAYGDVCLTFSETMRCTVIVSIKICDCKVMGSTLSCCTVHSAESVYL